MMDSATDTTPTNGMQGSRFDVNVRLSVIYGDDAPTIRRMSDDALTALSDAGFSPTDYKSMALAESDLISGGMFSEDFVGVVRDATDMAKSGTKRISGRWSAILDALGTYGDGTRLAVFFPSDTLTSTAGRGVLEKLVEAGAVETRVELPDYGALADWCVGYAASSGEQIKRSTAARVLDAVEGDAVAAAAIIDMLGEGLDSMTAAEIRQSSENSGEASAREIADAIMRCDAEALFDLRATFPEGSGGMRTFMSHVRAALLDCVLFDEDPNKESAKSYLSHRNSKNARWAKYARATDISRPMRTSPLSHGWARRKYQMVNDMMQRIYRGQASSDDLTGFICDLCSCDETRRENVSERRRKIREEMLARDKALDEGQ